MVSLDGLSKIVDSSHLTADFEGSLEYNHDEWIEVWRLSLLVQLFFKIHTNSSALYSRILP